MINQKTCTTYKIETYPLIGQEYLILRLLSLQVIREKNYGEIRRCALGYLGNRLHALVFTETTMGITVISFRKANKREIESYEQENKK